ncbi:MAG: outer membrane beta-barrel protein [Flavobacteriales bacterium]|nr:outer membrane beta-barrel protein [Flavobacteriales bacterium]MCB9197486.1 outer membrane beta-barrel protein [Flavobacteriales bacterium]
MRISISIFLISVFSLLKAQRVPEIGILAGGSYYLGDLNPYKHFDNTNFCGAFMYRDQIAGSDRLTYRLQIGFGTVEAYDSESLDPSLVNRNLSFRSRIIEIGPMIEVHFLPYEIGSNKRPFTPYMFLGLTYFKMNPMGKYNDSWIELQSLGTEGQGTPYNDKDYYKLNQISVPVGFGMKFNMNQRWSIGLEYGIRKTFTDYLDDVSGNYLNPSILAETNGPLSAQLSDQSLDNQGSLYTTTGISRGNSNTKDWYVFTGVTLSFRVIEYSTCPRRK